MVYEENGDCLYTAVLRGNEGNGAHGPWPQIQRGHPTVDAVGAQTRELLAGAPCSLRGRMMPGGGFTTCAKASGS